MAVQLSYELDTTAARAAARDLIDRADDLTPLMDAIGGHLVTSTRDRIATTNVGPDGVPWIPSFRVENFGGKTLADTGALLGSIVSQPEQRSVEVGSNLIYAGVHQTGAIITAKNGDALTFFLADGQMVEVASVEIPARPFLGISDEDEVAIGDLTEEYLFLAAAP